VAPPLNARPKGSSPDTNVLWVPVGVILYMQHNLPGKTQQTSAEWLQNMIKNIPTLEIRY
jgi:hypothetical protein